MSKKGSTIGKLDKEGAIRSARDAVVHLIGGLSGAVLLSLDPIQMAILNIVSAYLTDANLVYLITIFSSVITTVFVVIRRILTDYSKRG